MSSTPEFKSARHLHVWRALECLNSRFLAETCCYFGGGTRLVLDLGEYRQSADIDFLCADHSGYRRLRNTIKQDSLGAIVKLPLSLARDVRADRYGIRTFLDLAGEPVKFEIISAGRVLLEEDSATELPVPSLNAVSCFAEKFLANADRWADPSVLSRDAIDLAFMIKGWGVKVAVAGLQRATDAYGEVVVASCKEAIRKLMGDAGYCRHCLHELTVTDSRRLRSGLRALSRLIWAVRA